MNPIILLSHVFFIIVLTRYAIEVNPVNPAIIINKHVVHLTQSVGYIEKQEMGHSIMTYLDGTNTPPTHRWTRTARHNIWLLHAEYRKHCRSSGCCSYWVTRSFRLATSSKILTCESFLVVLTSGPTSNISRASLLDYSSQKPVPVFNRLRRWFHRDVITLFTSVIWNIILL